jgi:hypothetical protein
VYRCVSPWAPANRELEDYTAVKPFLRRSRDDYGVNSRQVVYSEPGQETRVVATDRARGSSFPAGTFGTRDVMRQESGLEVRGGEADGFPSLR